MLFLYVKPDEHFIQCGWVFSASLPEVFRCTWNSDANPNTKEQGMFKCSPYVQKHSIFVWCGLFFLHKRKSQK